MVGICKPWSILGATFTEKHEKNMKFDSAFSGMFNSAFSGIFEWKKVKIWVKKHDYFDEKKR